MPEHHWGEPSEFVSSWHNHFSFWDVVIVSVNGWSETRGDQPISGVLIWQGVTLGVCPTRGCV